MSNVSAAGSGGLDFELSELTTDIPESHAEVLDEQSDPDFETPKKGLLINAPSPLAKFHVPLEVGRDLLPVGKRRSY